MFDFPAEPAGRGARRLGRITAIALSACACALSAATLAAEPPPGMRVAKDPVTGQLRAPTADEAAALDSAGAAKTARRAPRGLITGKVNPPPVTAPDGTVSQELDESTLSYMVMTRDADGRTRMVCVTGTDAAQAALKGKKNVAATRAAAPQSKELTNDNDK